MKEFKIRASAAGQIMTNDRSGKNPGKTCISYLETWVKEQIYNRKKEISTWSMQKGLIMEDNGLDYVAENLGFGMLFKNEQWYSNDHMTGTPDVVLPELIIDLKNSWDAFTFPLFETDVPDSGYFWQAQTYMELTDTDHFKLIYVLMDTPIHLIKSAAWRFCRENGIEDLDPDVYTEYYKKMTYSDISAKHRIKVFDIERDRQAAKQLVDRVEWCRSYIYSYLNEI